MECMRVNKSPTIEYEQAATRHDHPIEVVNKGGRIWMLKSIPKFQLLTRASSVIVNLADMPEALKKALPLYDHIID